MICARHVHHQWRMVLLESQEVPETLDLAQVDILFCYFGIRKFATHWVSLGFFCMLVPLSTFTPEVCLCRRMRSLPHPPRHS